MKHCTIPPLPAIGKGIFIILVFVFVFVIIFLLAYPATAATTDAKHNGCCRCDMKLLTFDFIRHVARRVWFPFCFCNFDFVSFCFCFVLFLYGTPRYQIILLLWSFVVVVAHSLVCLFFFFFLLWGCFAILGEV